MIVVMITTATTTTTAATLLLLLRRRLLLLLLCVGKFKPLIIKRCKKTSNLGHLAPDAPLERGVQPDQSSWSSGSKSVNYGKLFGQVGQSTPQDDQDDQMAEQDDQADKIAR